MALPSVSGGGGHTRNRSLRDRLRDGITGSFSWHKRRNSKNLTVPDQPSKPRARSNSDAFFVLPYVRGKSRSVDQSFLPSFEIESLSRIRAEAAARRKDKHGSIGSCSAGSSDLEAYPEDSDGSANGDSHPHERKASRVTQPDNTITYMVQSSDTINSLAARFDTTPSELCKINRLTSRQIFPGQILFVPDKGDDSPSKDADITPVNTPGEAKTPDEVAAILGSIRPPSPPERSKTPIQNAALSQEEIDERIDRECYQRFLKINVRHITDGQGVVAGVLLVTPNAIMFDPNVSDPLVIEHGPERYGVIAPMEFVANAALYYDIAHMRVRQPSDVGLPVTPTKSPNEPKPEIYYGKNTIEVTESPEDEASPTPAMLTAALENLVEATNSAYIEQHANSSSPGKDSLLVKDETFPELAARCSPEEPDTVREDGGAFPKAFECDFVTPTPTPVPTPFLTDDIDFGEITPPVSTFDDITDPGEVNQILIEDSETLVDSGIEETTEKLIDINEEDDAFGPVTDDKQQTRSQKMLRHLSSPMTWMESFSSDSRSESQSTPPPNSADSTQSGSMFAKVFTSSAQNLVDFSANLISRAVDTGSELINNKGPLSPSLNVVLEECGEQESMQNGGSIIPKSPELEPWLLIEHSTVDKIPVTEKTKALAQLGYRSMVSVDDMPELFASFDKLIPRPAQSCNDPPLYLCLRMGKPLNRKISRSTPIMSYGKKMMRAEYWYSIPRDKVDDLYNFFMLWQSELYGELDEEAVADRGFQLVDSDTELWDDEDEDGVDNNKINKSDIGEFTKESWEVVAMSDEVRRALYGSSIGSSLDLDSLLPELCGESNILTEEHRKKLSKNLPARAEGYMWKLCFSTELHGFSISSLYRKMRGVESPVLLVIEDTKHNIFGAILASTLHVSEYFYGTGESLLFTFTPEFQVFNWSGDNEYFCKGNINSIAIGAGDGQFGIWIDGDLNQGRTQSCKTYNNDALVPDEDFAVKTVECWVFV